MALALGSAAAHAQPDEAAPDETDAEPAESPGADPASDPKEADDDASPPPADAPDEGPAPDAESAPDEPAAPAAEETAEEADERVEREEGSLGTLTEPGVVTLEQLQSATKNEEATEGNAPEDASASPAPESDGDDGEVGPSQTRDPGDREGKDDSTPAQGELGDLGEPSTTPRAPVAEDDTPQERTRLGPATIRLDERGDRITLGFAAQLRFDVDRSYDAATGDGDIDNGVQFRRLRTVLSSSFLDGRVRSSFQLNIAPNAFELIDAWGLYAPIPKLALRLGQFKIPYTRYRAQSFAALSRTDWSPVTGMFGSERQIGLELLNPAPDDTSVEYSVGLFTGQNARASHAVGLTETYGEQPDNPSNLRSGFGALTALHPELVGRAARNFGAIDTGSNTDILRGPLRHSLGVSVAGDFQPVEREDLTLRTAVEWLGKFHGAYVNAVAHVGWFPKTTGGTAFGPAGWLLEAGYRFDRTWEWAASYSHVLLSKALRRDARTYAATQLSDPELEDAQRERYMAAGDVRSALEIATTASAYLVGHSLKGQAEFGWRSAQQSAGRAHELYGRLQFQLQF